MGLQARWNLISLRAESNLRQGLRTVFPVSECRECFARSQLPTNVHGPPLRFALVAVEKSSVPPAIRESIWIRCVGYSRGSPFGKPVSSFALAVVSVLIG